MGIKGGKPASRKEGRETNSEKRRDGNNLLEEKGWNQSLVREGRETMFCKISE